MEPKDLKLDPDLMDDDSLSKIESEDLFYAITEGYTSAEKFSSDPETIVAIKNAVAILEACDGHVQELLDADDGEYDDDEDEDD